MDLNAQSQLEIRISCKNLLNLDVTSKSDAFAVVYLATGVQ